MRTVFGCLLVTFLSAGLISLRPLHIAGAEKSSTQAASIRIEVGKPAGRVSRYLTGACIEDVNHEIYGGIYSQMIFGESFQEPAPSRPATDDAGPVSGMWRRFRRGSATGKFALEMAHPFVGRQAQRISFQEGAGDVGIENQGLNRWGLAFVEGKPYEGFVWVRADRPAELIVGLESRDGTRQYAETKLAVAAKEWEKYDFTLTPSETDRAGRFILKLNRPGSVIVGHVFLQPGAWGRFKGLPVRRDVAQALIDQGITVLRYGGSMVNAAEYRWKKMIGPRDRRPPYKGTWYPYSTNGWGIVDFLNFCEAAHFLSIPAFNMDETPQDMADFVAYANGPPDSPWGKKRVADGHPAPYRLKSLELGNEERLDDHYWRRFRTLADAIWTVDPAIILVVADFAYDQPITDPEHVNGASSKITSLAIHQKILDLARQRGREVWFDIHISTDHPGALRQLAVVPTYVDVLARISGGAKHRVVIFELNSGNHAQRRALANAISIGALQALGERLPIVCAANCLQPDGENDNGWDQGLLFLNPSQVWLQPPGYVTRMLSRSYQPLVMKTDVKSQDSHLFVSASGSEDGKTMVLQVVNASALAVPSEIHLEGLAPSKPLASVEELAGPLDAMNTTSNPNRITPKQTEWHYKMKAGVTSCTFAPHSFTVLRFQ